MLLVPKQLQRVGMTGMVPYYGGRMSPAQAYGASHPSAPRPNFATPVTTGGAFARAPVPISGQSGPPSSPPGTQPDTQIALQHLLDAGVITQVEFQQLRARVIK
jgi:hypothetical protein